MQRGTRTRADLLGGAGWIGFGAAIVVGSWRMDRFEQMGATLYTMPGLVPGIVGLVLMLLGALLMLRAWRAARAGDHGGSLEPLANRRTLAFLGFSLAYAVGLVGRVPFWLGTALFVAAAVAWFSPSGHAPLRRYGGALAAGALTAAAITLVFEQLFLVRLP